MAKATLLVSSKQIQADGSLIEIVIWHVPAPVPPCDHHFKYSLVYIRDRVRVVGFDNERGKGDHAHVDGREFSFPFQDIGSLLRLFRLVVEKAKESGRNV